MLDQQASPLAVHRLEGNALGPCLISNLFAMIAKRRSMEMRVSHASCCNFAGDFKPRKAAHAWP
jgi:hypothetical protein